MDIIFEQLLSISAKFSVFLDETIGWANSWKVLQMRPVLRHCFLVPYVLLSASGNASVPAMNLPILLFHPRILRISQILIATVQI